MELNAQKLVVVPISPFSHKERAHFCVLQMKSHISVVYWGVLIQMMSSNLIINRNVFIPRKKLKDWTTDQPRLLIQMKLWLKDYE